jgi:alkylation response protein AidB-like acyl-CoA dehydrogenase
MDFSIPESMRPILDGIRRFVADQLVPLEPHVTRVGFVGAAAELAAVRAEVKARGFWAPQLGRDLGGMGLSLVEHGLVSEILGQSPLGHFCFGCQAPDAGNMEVLHLFGTPAQKARFLAPLAAGEIRSCFSMTEPERAGSNPTWLDTRAIRDGDDYVIRGRKWFTTAADGAAFAIVMAVTNPEAEPHRRASQIIVPCGTPGFRLVRNISIMGHAGSGWDSHAEIEYDDCRVPCENRLGQEGEGFRIAQERLGPGRIHHCMRWIGICERAFELMCARAARRELAPERALASRQIVQAWIAESRAEIDAARLMVLHAAWLIEREGAAAARVEVSTIKFFVAGVLERVLDRAMQVHGALGITDDTVLATFYRNERGARIYDGPDEVHKVVVARHALRRHGVQLS